MTTKQIALSQLAQLALKGVSEKPIEQQTSAYRITGAALAEECPELSNMALQTAKSLEEANEQQLKLTELLATE